jgi:putative oxidoreductase
MNNNKYVPVLLRLALGAVFILHGYGKLTGIEGTIGFFDKVGIPVPGFSAWLVALVEFLGGISVLVGYFTRISAGLIAIVMVVAMISVKFAQGFVGGWEFDFVLFIVAISLVILGDGDYSIAKAVKK